MRYAWDRSRTVGSTCRRWSPCPSLRGRRWRGCRGWPPPVKWWKMVKIVNIGQNCKKMLKIVKKNDPHRDGYPPVVGPHPPVVPNLERVENVGDVDRRRLLATVRLRESFCKFQSLSTWKSFLIFYTLTIAIIITIMNWVLLGPLPRTSFESTK